MSKVKPRRLTSAEITPLRVKPVTLAAAAEAALPVWSGAKAAPAATGGNTLETLERQLERQARRYRSW